MSGIWNLVAICKKIISEVCKGTLDCNIAASKYAVVHTLDSVNRIKTVESVNWVVLECETVVTCKWLWSCGDIWNRWILWILGWAADWIRVHPSVRLCYMRRFLDFSANSTRKCWGWVVSVNRMRTMHWRAGKAEWRTSSAEWHRHRWLRRPIRQTLDLWNMNTSFTMFTTHITSSAIIVLLRTHRLDMASLFDCLKLT